jgi:hypothetical protein
MVMLSILCVLSVPPCMFVLCGRVGPMARKKAAAAKPAGDEDGKKPRIVVELTEERKRALKVKAASEGLTIKEFILRLLEQAGV